LKRKFIFAETVRSFLQNNLKIYSHFFMGHEHLGHFCMTENGIMTKLTYVFSVISKQPRPVTENPQKNWLKHSQGKCF